MIIAAANMRGYYHILRLAFKCKIIYLKKSVFIFIRTYAENLCSVFSKSRAPRTIVKLKISAAGFIKLRNNILISRCNIIDKLIIRCIKFSCLLNISRNGELQISLCRCGNCVFGNRVLILKLL